MNASPDDTLIDAAPPVRLADESQMPEWVRRHVRAGVPEYAEIARKAAADRRAAQSLAAEEDARLKAELARDLVLCGVPAEALAPDRLSIWPGVCRPLNAGEVRITVPALGSVSVRVACSDGGPWRLAGPVPFEVQLGYHKARLPTFAAACAALNAHATAAPF